jgi:hypothetical protein
MKAFVHHASADQHVHSGTVAAEVRLTTGTWVVFAKADIRNYGGGEPEGVECVLDVGGVERVPDRCNVVLRDFNDRETVSLSIGFSAQGRALVRLICNRTTGGVHISNITITAIEVDSLTVSPAAGSSPPLDGRFQRATRRI